ncbi:PIN domain protein [Geminocystis sp. NIES-3708]|uniref:type II toxin-antitoxin system VapC family toxin n=1 Tax=Geminocystis sp. NIES-3708 TaxID=1615909 RepID=UPI0005FC6052|nr:PIN domain-containing protein [Geminocystis sp. NIES-3708]BAQ61151.1 PIN domain protein [Geminocystis sp. NIES-3708]
MIIADTGFFIALGNNKDKFHELAKQKLVTLKEKLVITYPLIVETSYLLLERCNKEAQFKFLNQLTKDSIDIFHLSNDNLTRMIELMKKYSDLPMDLADASLVILAEEIKENRILTTDFRDFNIYC